MSSHHGIGTRFVRLSLFGIWIVTMTQAFTVRAETVPFSQDTLLRARQVTVGILADTQDPRSPERSAKVVVRGTGFHFRDGYVITARHAVEKHDLSTGMNVQKHIFILTHDLHELPADLVGDSAFMDVVVYRIPAPHRFKLQAEASFSPREISPGIEIFTVGYPLGWGPTLAFGRLGNINAFLHTVDTRLLQADLSACSGNSGGGLFNVQGEIVGILHAVIQTDKEENQTHCSRMTFAIPGNLVERIVDAVLAGKPLAFSRLGIHMSTVKDGTKLRLAVKDIDEPAKSAGIQRHDILLAIEGTEILDGAQLKNYLIERTRPGQEVAVKVRRVDVDLTFHVILGGGTK
ncbi:MAG: serine protease [Nitrospira sp.]